MDALSVAEVLEQLDDLIRQAELEAARNREFVPDGCIVSVVVSSALAAAVESGVAIGLNRARAILIQSLTGGE